MTVGHFNIAFLLSEYIAQFVDKLSKSIKKDKRRKVGGGKRSGTSFLSMVKKKVNEIDTHSCPACFYLRKLCVAVLPFLLDFLSFCRDSLPVTLVLEHLTVQGTFSEGLK